MLHRSFCNRLTQQDLVSCCAAGRAPLTVGHSRISSRNSDSKNFLSSKPGLLSRRRQKKVANLVFVRSASTDLSAGLLEAVATAALQSRLRLHDKVEADISCNLLGLLAGQVDSVHIYGTGWQSKAGLTARVLEVFLGKAQLDIEAILTKQRILLKSIPRGTAKIVFTARDFGHFLAHPLLRQAAATAVQGQLFAFDEHSVQFNSFYGPSGAISFSGRWQADGHSYSLTMVPQGNTAQVTALTEEVSEALSEQDLEMTAISADLSGADKASLLVSEELSRFFSNLTISLQGIQLSYNSMKMSSQTSGADGDVLELHLGVAVLEFPPPNLDF
ncbi:hypothetical protein WJX82_005664 [Trebouxia sp. C0006]